MKKVYLLNTVAMNGTVTSGCITDVFLDRDLAERCQKVISVKNEENSIPGFRMHSKIVEATLFENESECQCLKGEIKEYEEL